MMMMTKRRRRRTNPSPSQRNTRKVEEVAVAVEEAEAAEHNQKADQSKRARGAKIGTSVFQGFQMATDQFRVALSE